VTAAARALLDDPMTTPVRLRQIALGRER